jgi:hypothetical protein
MVGNHRDPSDAVLVRNDMMIEMRSIAEWVLESTLNGTQHGVASALQKSSGTSRFQSSNASFRENL